MTDQTPQLAEKAYTGWHLPAWHGCMTHNHNHCPECQSCSCWERA